jgi:PKD repeat protein
LTAPFTNTSATGPNPTYLWNFGDGNTSTIANPRNIYSASGPYTVTLTITNDCGSTTFTDSILLTVAGIDELLVNGDVNVFPNPSNGEFTIDMELISNSNVSFRVENLVGALVYETQSITIDGAHSETISLGNVPTGVYFVNIQVGDNNLVKKLIIE